MPVKAASPSGVPLAATVLVVRAAELASTADIEVLLVRRSHRASFMANAYVFPGGRVDAADAPDAPEASAGAAAAADHADAGEAAAALRAARRAAARELAEEVGLQVSDLAQLVRFAHWITPSAEPKRFDTQFFLWPLTPPPPAAAAAQSPAAAPPAALPEVRVDGREVFDPLWITPAEALSRYAAGALNLPPPTACTLEDLAAEIAAARLRAAEMGSLLQALLLRCVARRPLPALPKFFADDRGLAIVMPWDPAYPELSGDGVPQPALAADAAPVPRRIRRCLLKMESVGASYAITPPAPTSPAMQNEGATPSSGVGSGSGNRSRPAAATAPAVPWTIERAES